MKDTFCRIVGGDEAVMIAPPAVDQARRLAVVVAEALDALSAQCGGRPDLTAWAASLRAEFGVAPAVVATSGDVVRVDRTEEPPR